jgi:hypothetical protein
MKVRYSLAYNRRNKKLTPTSKALVHLLGLSKDSVNSVILTAGAYAEAAMSNLLKNLHLNECQMG